MNRNRRVILICFLFVSIVCGGCKGLATCPEGMSLRGRELWSKKAGADNAAEARLTAAADRVRQMPDDLDARIWLGRRYGYLWRMNDAVREFSIAARRWPNDPRPLRHWGHRLISLRKFDDAIRELKRAAALLNPADDSVEPDGVPNERNIPLTTIGFNVWYHLALAHYLKGDYAAALDGWRRTAEFEHGHDDNRVAVAYWTHLTLRRLGRESEARAALESLRPEMDIVENRAYHRLVLCYKGLLTREQLLSGVKSADADFAAIGYGLALQDMLDGHTEIANALFDRVLACENWPAFGFIASEVVRDASQDR